MRIVIIGVHEAKRFIADHHYAILSPPHVLYPIGLFFSDKLVGVAEFGWGVRPLHTIRGLFPSLISKDYLELNRFCVLDEMPRNSETQFLSQCVGLLKAICPELKLIFSWADGLRGKLGYVYQAASWYYGGFIKSEYYITKTGEVLHPRLMITRYGTRGRATWQGLGLRHIRGYQFRYCKFLCKLGEVKRLLRESPIEWRMKDYPKADSLKFWIDAGEGSRETCQLPKLEGSGQFRKPAPLFQSPLGGI